MYCFYDGLEMGLSTNNEERLLTTLVPSPSSDYPIVVLMNFIDSPIMQRSEILFKSVLHINRTIVISIVALLNFMVLQSTAQTLPDTFNLKETIITGTYKELRRENFAIPVEIYTADYFKTNNVYNLQDAIRMISGLQANIDGGVDGAADIEINGMEGTYALVMLDGAPITGGTGNLYGLMGIPMSIIDRIEVIKGPSSTLYGTEAIAGVLNVITINPARGAKVAVDARLSSYLENSLDVAACFKEGKANGLFSASVYNMNYRWDFNKDNFMDIPLQNRVALFNKWSFRNKYQKSSSVFGRYLWEQRTGGEMQFKKSMRGTDERYAESIITNRVELMGNFILPIATADVNLMFGFSNHNSDATYGLTKFRNTERNGYLQMTYDYKIGKISDLLIGLVYRFNWYDDNLLTTQDTTDGKNRNKPIVNQFPALFLQDMIHFNENNEVLVGLRIEYNTYFTNVAFAPRFDYKWMDSKKKNEVRFGIGTGYRTPTAFIDDKYAFTSGRRIEVSENLKIETAYGTHIDYIRKVKTNKVQAMIESRLFYTFIQNMVEPEIDFDNNVVRYENENALGMNFGLNVMADLEFTIPLKLNVGVNVLGNFMFEKEDGEETWDIERPRNSPYLNAVFGIQYTFAKVGVTIDWSGLLNSPMRMNVQENDPRNEYSPWYTIQNVQCTKRFKKGVEIFAGINNIFNVRPPQPILRPNDPFGRNPNADGLVFDATYNYAPNQGIRGYFGIRYVLR